MTSWRYWALAALLLALVACQREAEQPAAARPPAARMPAATPSTADVTHPQLKVTTLDGVAYDLSEHRGQWVVVNYWATWCGPCLEEMPELSALDVMRDNIEVIGLAYEDSSPDVMRAFLKQHPVTYPIALIDVYEPPKDFGAPRGLPTSWLIRPDGRLARKYTGPMTARMLEDDIAKFGQAAAD